MQHCLGRPHATPQVDGGGAQVGGCSDVAPGAGREGGWGREAGRAQQVSRQVDGDGDSVMREAGKAEREINPPEEVVPPTPADAQPAVRIKEEDGVGVMEGCGQDDQLPMMEQHSLQAVKAEAGDVSPQHTGDWGYVQAAGREQGASTTPWEGVGEQVPGLPEGASLHPAAAIAASESPGRAAAAASQPCAAAASTPTGARLRQRIASPPDVTCQAALVRPSTVRAEAQVSAAGQGAAQGPGAAPAGPVPAQEAALPVGASGRVALPSSRKVAALVSAVRAAGQLASSGTQVSAEQVQRLVNALSMIVGAPAAVLLRGDRPEWVHSLGPQVEQCIQQLRLMQQALGGGQEEQRREEEWQEQVPQHLQLQALQVQRSPMQQSQAQRSQVPGRSLQQQQERDELPVQQQEERETRDGEGGHGGGRGSEEQSERSGSYGDYSRGDSHGGSCEDQMKGSMEHGREGSEQSEYGSQYDSEEQYGYGEEEERGGQDDYSAEEGEHSNRQRDVEEYEEGYGEKEEEEGHSADGEGYQRVRRHYRDQADFGGHREDSWHRGWGGQRRAYSRQQEDGRQGEHHGRSDGHHNQRSYQGDFRGERGAWGPREFRDRREFDGGRGSRGYGGHQVGLQDNSQGHNRGWPHAPFHQQLEHGVGHGFTEPHGHGEHRGYEMAELHWGQGRREVEMRGEQEIMQMDIRREQEVREMQMRREQEAMQLEMRQWQQEALPREQVHDQVYIRVEQEGFMVPQAHTHARLDAVPGFVQQQQPHPHFGQGVQMVRQPLPLPPL